MSKMLRSHSALGAAIALSFGFALSGCGDTPNNRTLYSVKQPVVERNNFTLDLAATPGGLTVPERARLADWFETMNLRYGDRVAIDSATTGDAAREDVAAIASRYGILLSDGAPVTVGHVEPGMVRLVVTRSRAHVPGCPDWSDQMASNLGNSTTDDFGCSVNSNIAAMIADPQHLLQGAEGSGETVVMSSTKAIETYRQAEPTGAAGLSDTSSQEVGGN